MRDSIYSCLEGTNLFIKKIQHWSEYNKYLVKRGQLLSALVFFYECIEQTERSVGCARHYTRHHYLRDELNLCICLENNFDPKTYETIKSVPGRPFRQFGESLDAKFLRLALEAKMGGSKVDFSYLLNQSTPQIDSNWIGRLTASASSIDTDKLEDSAAAAPGLKNRSG